MPNDPLTIDLSTELLLVDLSSIAHPMFHMASSSSDPDTTATQVVDKVRALASDHPHAAVCCDSGRSFRYDIDKTYKAQRPEQDAALQHQITRACETLAGDGFPVWRVKGCEADDLIASAVAQTLALDGARVLIASADKDLLQLVNDRVQVKSLKDGSRLDAAWVVEKFSVPPAQIRDLLTLMGDSSDNIKGAFNIGPKKAAALLQQYESVEGIYAALDAPETSAKFPRGIRESLDEFRERWPTVRELVTLRADVAIPFFEVASERTPHDAPSFIEEDAPPPPPAPPPPAPPRPVAVPPPPPTASAPPARVDDGLDVVAEPTLMPAPAPQDWGKQLEPRSMNDAITLARFMFAARLFAGYGTPQAVLSTILAGRELGFNSIASLRAFHIIDSKHSLAADAMRALVLRSGAAKYFRIVERTADRCTWETWRHGDPEAIRLSFTIQQARTAWQKDERAWNNGPYTKTPEDMLSARASSKLARLVYADILFGLYSPEELRDEVA